MKKIKKAISGSSKIVSPSYSMNVCDECSSNIIDSISKSEKIVSPSYSMNVCDECKSA